MGASAARRSRKKQSKEREKNSEAFLHILRECSTQLEAVWQAEDDARARIRLNEVKVDNPEIFAQAQCGRKERKRRKKAQASRKLAKVEGIILGVWTIHPEEREVKVNFGSGHSKDTNDGPLIKYWGFYDSREVETLIKGLKNKGNYEMFDIQNVRDIEPNSEVHRFRVLSKNNQPPPGPLPSPNDGYFVEATESPVTYSATSSCLTSGPEDHTPGSESNTAPSISTPVSLASFSYKPYTTFDSILGPSSDDHSTTDSSSRLSSASRFSLSSLSSLASNLTGELRSRIGRRWKR